MNSQLASLCMFSPRMWGWSVPTAIVGMLTTILPTFSGDGPEIDDEQDALAKFSPRVWGRSE